MNAKCSVTHPGCSLKAVVCPPLLLARHAICEKGEMLGNGKAPREGEVGSLILSLDCSVLDAERQASIFLKPLRFWVSVLANKPAP